ncbi:MAG: cytochrome P450 [Polyangiaceae bacterium]|nr:cytochrome P450 [Polyangiaceae bacterium]
MSALPRGPSSIIGPFIHYYLDPYGVFSACARRYGDPFLLPLPGTRGTAVACDPEGVKAIIGAEPDTLEAFRHESAAACLGEHSLFFESGAAHRASRRILGPPFHGSRLPSYGPIMADIAAARTGVWRPGAVISVQETAAWISLEVIVRAVFGASRPERVARFHSAIQGGFDTVGPAVHFFRWLRHELGGVGPWARAQRMKRELMALVEEEIAARRAEGGEGDDVLSLLLRARHADGSAMSQGEVRDKLFDLLIAGYETTGIAVAWAVYEILRHPPVEERLRAEIDALGDEPDPAEAVKLPFLDAVIGEVLRVHPVFSLLTRKVARPLDVKGHRLPAGLGVSMALAPVHFREEVYPDARAFRPERFLGRAYSPSEYLPFGGGATRCLGATFGTHELKIVLATIFRRYRLRLATDRPVRPAVRSATVEPAGGVRVMVAERRAG